MGFIGKCSKMAYQGPEQRKCRIEMTIQTGKGGNPCLSGGRKVNNLVGIPG